MRTSVGDRIESFDISMCHIQRVFPPTSFWYPRVFSMYVLSVSYIEILSIRFFFRRRIVSNSYIDIIQISKSYGLFSFCSWTYCYKALDWVGKIGSSIASKSIMDIVQLSKSYGLRNLFCQNTGIMYSIIDIIQMSKACRLFFLSNIGDVSKLDYGYHSDIEIVWIT